MPICEFDPKTKVPIIQPLRTLEELREWDHADDEFCKANINLPKKNAVLPERPRTLVCHDMAGGYLQDRFVQGVGDRQAYRFYHWQYLDTFIYFSHHFVSVPPPCWVNAAHQHGVKILGTFITEWDDGKRRCDSILKCEKTCIEITDTLVRLTEAYKLDGWLINIENEIKEEEVKNLVTFVRELTEKLHSKVGHSQVVWYDSVTCEGKLKWQNQLDDLNICFFNASDAMFLNYGWDKEKLESSYELCMSLKRPHDVYVGVDVWGRGCFGGGGFATDLAVAVAKECRLSTAIFAQGWVYEKLGEENYTVNENKFWGLLDHLCNIHDFTQLPFSSTFCQGCGSHFYINGEMVSDANWLNLTCQSLQPSYTDIHQFGMIPVEERPHKQCIEWYTADAYIGGGCLKIAGQLGHGIRNLTYKLFKMEIELPEDPMLICLTYKKLHAANCGIHLQLKFKTATAEKIVLFGEVQCDNNDTQLVPLVEEQLKIINSAWMRREHNGWVTRYFMLEPRIFEDCSTVALDEISVGLSTKEMEDPMLQSVLLGQIQIMKSNTSKELPLITNFSMKKKEFLEETSNMNGRVIIELSWTYPVNTAKCFLVFMTSYYNCVKKERILMGQTDSLKFIASFEHQTGMDYVIFHVQPVLLSGFVLPWYLLPSVKYEILQSFEIQ